MSTRVENYNNFKHSVIHFVGNLGTGDFNQPAIISLVFFTIVLLSKWDKIYPVLIAFGIASAAFLSFLPIIFPASVYSQHYFNARAFVSTLPVLVFFLMLVAMKSRISIIHWSRISVWIVVFGVSQITWDIAATYQWSRYRDHFKNELENNRGYIEHAESRLTQHHLSKLKLSNFGWAWTYPLISITSSKKVSTIIKNPVKTRWEPFPPEDVSRLPDLEKYGIYYDL